MHETAIAEELFKVIIKEAQKQNASPVSATMACGMLNAVNDEIMQFAFTAIAKGTVCEKMTLKVVHKPLRGQCKKCDAKFEVEFSNPQCSDCGSDSFVLLPDEPIMLQDIEFNME